MERAVLTGILRVAKESMFSGANNIKVYSFVNDLFSEQFGLLHDEVQDLSCGHEKTQFFRTGMNRAYCF